MFDRRSLFLALAAAALAVASPAAAQYPGYRNDERSPRRRRGWRREAWSRRDSWGRRPAVSARDRMLIDRQQVPSSYGPPSPWN
ncbi:hypothetical protein [Phreatobacter stygius]|uniref:Uncharacterized protein n=1 Tax=Phreatobacter stygius TaxID=1940610 RepID=A0A4D7B0Y2_9HYPH|nr:hypothetical protein [Phreatobacter stygius]QCI63116.1 hypothetical protein E8M01_02010 [Phreatobacter stygius]